MKKLIINASLMLALIASYGCNSSNKNVDQDVAAEQNAKSGYGNDPNNDSGTAGAMADGQQMDTTSFPIMAASGSMMEVAAGELAQQKGANPEVKSFGQQMVTDHGKANAELKTIAASKNIMLPPAPLPKHQAHLDQLNALNGAEFDRQYMNMMVMAHQEDVALFERATNDANLEPELKAFAEKTLPVLKMHLDMAQKTQAKVK